LSSQWQTIQFAIFDTKTRLYFRNTGYSGRWSVSPKLWMRKGDATSCLKRRSKRWDGSPLPAESPWRTAIVIPMQVDPL
jgi:hypothetical protein